MHPRDTALAVFVFFLFCLLPIQVHAIPGGTEAPKASAGILDLRGLGPQDWKGIRLQGEWDFYPGLLLKGTELAANENSKSRRRVPDSWKAGEGGSSSGQGGGTYRLRILLPPTAPALALRYSTMATAFELDSGDRTLVRVGRPSLDKAEAVAAYHPGVIALGLAATNGAGEASLDLVVRVSNHEYRVGGMWRSPVLGEAAGLEEEKRKLDILSYSLAAAILMMILNAFALFAFRSGERSYLYFALMGLGIGVRLLVTGEYLLMDIFPALPFEALIRIEYLSVALPIPLALQFYRHFFPKECSPRLAVCLSLPFGLLLLAVPFAPLPLLTRTVLIFYPVAAASVLLIFFRVLLPAALDRKEGALLIIIGSFALTAAAVNDALYSSFVVERGSLLGPGLLVFVAVHALVLAKRFTQALAQSEVLQEELASTAGRLAQENERYRMAARELESALAEKDLLLSEVHHRVKNSLQIVSSTLGLQSHGTKDPLLRSAIATIRARLRAISMVSERLYTLDGKGRGGLMDLGGYLEALAGQLVESFAAGGARVGLTVETGKIQVSPDAAIDLGLILTELVSNACRHGLAKGGEGLDIAVEAQGGAIVLQVQDGGPGFPQGFDPQAARGLGFRIILSLVRKYSGSLKAGEGSRVRISLPGLLEGRDDNEKKEIEK